MSNYTHNSFVTQPTHLSPLTRTKEKRLATTPYRQSQIYLSQETKKCPKSPKLRAIALFTNSGSKGTRMMNRRLKTRTFSKSKKNKSAHFLQLAISVIYNNYTYIHTYIYTYIYIYIYIYTPL